MADVVEVRLTAAEIAELEAIDATEYTIGYSIPDNEARVMFYGESGPLSSFITDAAGLYEFAQRLMRTYDKLEGL